MSTSINTETTATEVLCILKCTSKYAQLRLKELIAVSTNGHILGSVQSTKLPLRQST